MSICRQRDALFWASFFSVSEKEKKQAIKQIQNYPVNFDRQSFAQYVLDATGISLSDIRCDNPATQSACERVALKFMIADSDFAKDFLDSEEYEKAKQTFARKQFNSKVLQKLLSYFLKALSQWSNNLSNLFTIAILDEIRIAEEEEADRTYGALKKVIEKVAAGVKSGCYFEAEHGIYMYRSSLSEELNRVVIEHAKYDFNAYNNRIFGNKRSTLFCNREDKENNLILQTALLNDPDFWASHEHFSIVGFLNEIAKQNGQKHAEKVVLYLLGNLQKIPNMELVIKNGFPLWMSKYEELVNALEAQAHRFAFKRLEPFCDVSALNEITLCYPMSQADTKCFEIGHATWGKFIREYNYPSNGERVQKFLNGEVAKFVSGETYTNNDIAVILDGTTFRYSVDNADRRLFAAYCPDCFSAENIWKRVYLIAYAVTLLSADEKTQFSYLQHIFVDLIKTVEERTGICTAHQLDESGRNESYEKLKEKLSSFGVSVSDTYKEEYIVSLLDRDTALLSEAKLFPELEQLGDAVYGLAVAELLFYRPQTEEMAKQFENYTRAEAQVKISVKNGFDKLYLQTGLPAKYVEYDTMFTNTEAYVLKEEELQTLNQEKYLADSLEMIIGTVCKDSGVFEAIRLAKELLMKTFPKVFAGEIHPTDESIRNSAIEQDYWSRILPALCSDSYDDYTATLSRALDKLMLCVSIGTDTKEKRQFITYSFGGSGMYGDDDGTSSWFFYQYLTGGLSSVLEKYKATVQSYYQNRQK